MGLKQQGLGLQLASIASQVELNKSEADKNKAEADKIAGVDTDVQKATMDNIIAQTANEKIKKGLIYADTRFKDAMEELTRSKVDALQKKGYDPRSNQIPDEYKNIQPHIVTGKQIGRAHV